MSLKCTARYIVETYQNKELWDTYSLLNLYYNVVNKTIGQQIIPSPNRFVINSFGGPISIKEYRDTNINYDIKVPPIVPISNSINKHVARTKIKDTDVNLKLYRKNNLSSKQDIFSKMNIK